MYYTLWFRFYLSLLVRKGDYVVSGLKLLCTASVFGGNGGYINIVYERFEELNPCFLSTKLGCLINLEAYVHGTGCGIGG